MAALRYFFSLLMVPVSFLIAAAGVVAFMAGRISPEESGLVTSAGLVMPGILIANLIVAIYWVINKSRWIILPLTIILLNIGYLTSVFQISLFSPAIPQGAIPVRIATYNVGNFKSWEKWETQYYITDFLRNENVNIACFQEYSERPKIKADTLSKLLGLPYYAVEYLPGSKTNGSAIFSKFPILQQGQIPLGSPTNDAMWADIQLENRTIRIINCHLQTTNFTRKRRELANPALANALTEQKLSVYNDISNTLLHNSQIRARQADMIRHFIDTTAIPVIVCGDFNDPPSAYTYHRIKGSLKDSFRSRGKGYGYTFRGIRRLLRIDYILYSPDFICTEYISNEQVWSDHNPIICEFYLETGKNIITLHHN